MTRSHLDTKAVFAAFALGAAALISVGPGCGGGTGGSAVGGGDTTSTTTAVGGGGSGTATTTSSSSVGGGGGAVCTPPADEVGDCKKVVCNAVGQLITQPDDADKPDDANDCTDDVCVTGLAQHPPSAKDTPCSTGGGAFCDGAGKCVACTAGSQCPSGICQSGVCKTPAPDCQTATAGGDATGIWTATVGDMGYLEVQQTGACVTGQTCEHAGFDCYPLQGGVLSGNQLSYYYTFGTFRTDATLTLSANGTTLMGELYSDKCMCSIPHTYVKQ